MDPNKPYETWPREIREWISREILNGLCSCESELGRPYSADGKLCKVHGVPHRGDCKEEIYRIACSGCEMAVEESLHASNKGRNSYRR